MSAASIGTLGLILNLIGVLILFAFGMPYQLRAGGGDMIHTNPTPEGIRRERRNQRLGYAGLTLIIAGTSVLILAYFI